MSDFVLSELLLSYQLYDGCTGSSMNKAIEKARDLEARLEAAEAAARQAKAGYAACIEELEWVRAGLSESAGAHGEFNEVTASAIDAIDERIEQLKAGK